MQALLGAILCSLTLIGAWTVLRALGRGVARAGHVARSQLTRMWWGTVGVWRKWVGTRERRRHVGKVSKERMLIEANHALSYQLHAMRDDIARLQERLDKYGPPAMPDDRRVSDWYREDPS